MGLDMYLTLNGKQVGCWRKFNALHGWFVDNVQGGVDKCGIYPVYVGHLKQLVTTLNQVSDDHSKASILFPTRSGSYFGNTDYDDYYFIQVRQTSKLLSDLIEKNDDFSTTFYYQADW